MEEAEAPFRCRLQKNGLKFSRDIAKWEKRAPLRRRPAAAVGAGKSRVDERDWDNGERVGGSADGGADGDGAGGAAFFAFPLVVHNSHAHHVVSIQFYHNTFQPL